jgi:hypothetical protein
VFGVVKYSESIQKGRVLRFIMGLGCAQFEDWPGETVDIMRAAASKRWEWDHPSTSFEVMEERWGTFEAEGDSKRRHRSEKR